MLRLGVILLSSSLLLACGGMTANTPVVTPATATVSATISWDPFKNKLGDQLQAVNVRITTDIPVRLRIQVHLDQPSNFEQFHDGDNYAKCLPDGCLISNGKALADWWCSNSCPRGTYTVRLDACSYAEEQGGLSGLGIRCNHQEPAYLDWVGKQGANLGSNPLAQVDPDHSAIRNLHYETSSAMTASGQIATSDQVAATKARVDALKAGDQSLTAAANAVNNACGGLGFKTLPCQQALQAMVIALDQINASVNRVALACAQQQDGAYLKLMGTIREAYRQQLVASQQANSAAFNLANGALRGDAGQVTSLYNSALDAPCP